MSEPQKTVIAGCLFIAYEATDADLLFRERKISYHERSILAPATNQEVLTVFATLERFFKVKDTKSFVGDGDEASDQPAISKAKGRNAFVEDEQNAVDAESIVDESPSTLVFFETSVIYRKTLFPAMP